MKKLRLEWIEAGSLADNPANWRRHPEPQLNALKGMIADPEVGWAGALLFNERTGRLIDGHARKSIADPKEPLPVLVGNWSEEAEKKILLTLDPLAAMATPDPEALAALLDEVNLDSDALKTISYGLVDVIASAPIVFDETPDPVQENIAEMDRMKSKRREENAEVASSRDTEKFLVLVYPSRSAKASVLRALGLPEDERYVPAEAIELRVKTGRKLAAAVDKDGQSLKTSGADQTGACG